MEVIFMDSAFQMTRIMDAFTSLIWNDYYIGFGDFEVRLPMDSSALIGVKEGYYASIKESPRYMIVEGIDIDTSKEEGNYAVITGRSLESILDRRIIRNHTILTGSFQKGILRLLNANLSNPEDEKRQIARLVFEKSEDPTVINEEINIEIEAGELLYNVIYSICEERKIGFRVLPRDDGVMLFSLYAGVDRSYAQETNPWVVFSPTFENIKETKMRMDTSNLRTTIIAESSYTWRIDGEDVEETLTVTIGGDEQGFDRRELYLKSNVTPEAVDKDAFGKPTDRVNKVDYSTWEAIYFDKDAYDKAMEAFNEKLRDAYVPRKEETTVNVWVPYKPGDPGYLIEAPEGYSVSEWPGAQISTGDPARVNGYWRQETVPGDTVEQWKKNNERFDWIAEHEEPDRESYMDYGWVLSDYNGYQNALNAAQAAIDAEFAAALEDSRQVARDCIYEEALAKLAPYLSISEFEGEVDENVQFLFGESYDLGDLVQIVNEYNFQAKTRVVGVMFSEEEGVGVRIIPKFESDDKAVFEL